MNQTEEARASGIKVGNTSKIYTHRHMYTLGPSMCICKNGDWLLAFNQAPMNDGHIQHPPMDPQYRNYVIRSSDKGKTWSKPIVVPDYNFSGLENPGIVALENGDIVLTQFKFDWLPLPLARKKWEQGEKISIRVVDKRAEVWTGWSESAVESDWGKTLPWGRKNDGAYSHVSTDNGNTFEHTTKIDTGEFRSGITQSKCPGSTSSKQGSL